MRSSIAAFAILFLAAAPGFSAAPAGPLPPDAREIVRKSVDLDQYNWKKAQDYTYLVREQKREDGKTSSKTYEVTALYGREFRRLVARDDKPLPAAGAAKEQHRYDSAVAARVGESDEKRARQAAYAETEREKDRAFAREIPDAYDFHLLGEERVDGHDSWIVSATPRPDFHPKDSRAKALPKLRGKIWIGKNDYEWVKVEGEVISPFRWGLFLASLNPGTNLRFVQTRVNDEIWMPKTMIVRLDARLLFKRFDGDYENSFSNYRKFQTEAKIVSASEAAPAASPASSHPK